MTLRVFVAGATGVLGRRLVGELADRGHVAVGLARDREGDELVAERGGVPRRGDVLDQGSLEWAAADADVVVHAASAVPVERKPDEDAWRRNDRVRRQGARNLTNAAAMGDARRYVQASLAWIVRDDDGSTVDETSRPNPDRTTRSALAAERRARAAERFGLEPVILRCGWFYAADSAQTRRLARGLLRGRLPAVGGGLLGRRDARLSLVHPDDAARAFADAVEGPSPVAGPHARGEDGAGRPTADGAGHPDRRATDGAGRSGRPGIDGTGHAGRPATDGAGPVGRSGTRPVEGPGSGRRAGGRRPNTFHVVDEEPVSFARFLRALADRLDADRPRRIPGWLARPLLGAHAVRFLTTGFPTDAERFRTTYGWEPTYPTYREGLDRVVERWRERGVLAEADGGREWRGA